MSQIKISKEKIVYEISISLGLEPEGLSADDIVLPQENDPLYNAYLALKNNLKILEGM